MRSQLQQLFGCLTPWILQPRRSLVACSFAWLITLPFTWQHLWLSLLGFTALWSLTLALYIEAPLLQTLPLPPLTVLLIGLSLRWGLGPLLLAVGGSGDHHFLETWIRYGPHSQLLYLSFTVSLLLFAVLQSQPILRAARSQPQYLLISLARNDALLYSRIKVLALVLSIYMAAYLFLSTFSGAFDRQFDVYVRWTHQLWRLDTPVAAFSRIRDLWFLLFPLWFRLLSRSWRWFLCTELLWFVLSALLSGSRGLLFYPAILLLFGLWFVLSDPRPIRRLAIGLGILILVLSPLIYVVRDSRSFQLSDNWVGRVQSVGTSLINPAPVLARARWIGRDLYACHDPFLFVDKNQDNQPAGFEGLGALKYLWFPKHLLPSRPILFDGHLIAKELQGVPQGPKNDVWFPCFSLPADLFRRWSLVGLIAGSIFVSSLIHILLRAWYRTASVNGTTFQLLLLLLPSTYLQSFPLGTVSETAWAFLWELPKYLLTFWLLGSLIDRYLSRAKL